MHANFLKAIPTKRALAGEGFDDPRARRESYTADKLRAKIGGEVFLRVHRGIAVLLGRQLSLGFAVSRNLIKASNTIKGHGFDRIPFRKFI